jgi:hypothetical protein
MHASTNAQMPDVWRVSCLRALPPIHTILLNVDMGQEGKRILVSVVREGVCAASRHRFLCFGEADDNERLSLIDEWKTRRGMRLDSTPHMALGRENCSQRSR